MSLAADRASPSTPIQDLSVADARRAGPPGGKLFGLQAGRAIAALSVLVQHGLHEARSIYHAPDARGFPWNVGVDLFFVISGFIIVFTSDRLFRRPGGVTTFLRRRFLRVVPLYWIFTTLMVLAIFVAGDRLNTAVFDARQVVFSYLFYPGYARADGSVSPVLALGWTLNYEVFFYAVFAPLVLLSRRWAVGVIVAGFTALAALSLVTPWGWTPLRFWTDPIILDFVGGAVLGSLYLDGVRIGRGLALALAAGALAVLAAQMAFVQDFARIPGLGVPAVALVAALGLTWGEHRPTPWPPVLLALGDASYSIYLSHPFTLKVVAIVWEKAHLHRWAPMWAYAVVAVVASALAGWLCYRLLERRLMRLFHRDRAAVAPSPA